MAPKTVKSGILLPNLTTFIPLFSITFQTSYNFNILQSTHSHFSLKKEENFLLPRDWKCLFSGRKEALSDYFIL